MTDKFTDSANTAIENAMALASELGNTYIGSEHLLYGLCSAEEGFASKLLSKYGIEADDVRTAVEGIGETGEPTELTIRDMTPRTKKIIETAAYQAMRLGQNYVGSEHLLLALLSESECVGAKLIANSGTDPNALAKEIIAYAKGFDESAGQEGEGRPSGEKGGAKQNSPLKNVPTLLKYGRDLTQMARDGKIDPIIGRNEEMQRVIQILSRRTKNNPCLIGEPGVGKTAVVEGLAQRIVDGSVPETLVGKSIVVLDVAGMLAGAKYRGEFEERIKKVLEEVKANSNVILFIDEIHTIIGAGDSNEGSLDAANILKPELARGEIQVIGATTIKEYRKHIEKDSALERRFQSVLVGEPSDEDTVLILKGLRDKYESHHKVKITDEAIEAAVKLSKRYITDRFFPDKAIDLIDEAASKKRIADYTVPPEIKELENSIKKNGAEKDEAVKAQDFEKAAKLRDEGNALKEKYDAAKSEWQKSRGEGLSIGAEEIADIVTAWTGIPVKKLADEEGARLAKLDSILKERIIGQDEAVDVVSRAIRRGRMGLKDPKRPMGSFLFLGPTGVGKTELTKALADVLFGDENAMIRIDMSEYMEKHSVSKLIGSPPGYVGYEEGGQLTEKIRRKPYSVVLFDEIEKAHPDVFNILLQILDDGVLTDSQGRKVDFKNSVIIMTSNLGAQALDSKKSSLGFSGSDDGEKEKASVRDTVMEYVKAAFRPEFINRIDEIVVFNRLTDENIRRIASIMLKEVASRVKNSGIDVTFDDSVAALVAKEGFDPVYGARPLRRDIQRRIEDSLSMEMLEGRIKAGDKVTAKAVDGNIVYEKTE